VQTEETEAWTGPRLEAMGGEDSARRFAAVHPHRGKGFDIQIRKSTICLVKMQRILDLVKVAEDGGLDMENLYHLARFD
jgi:hypothetical protein